MATVDDEAAAVLNFIPDEGSTVSLLAEGIKIDADRVTAAVQRLNELRLVEQANGVIRITPFAQKARGFFKFVA